MTAGVIGILEFGLFVFLATVAASALVALGAHGYTLVLEHLADTDKLRQKIAMYSRIASGLSDRVESRKNTAAGAATQLFAAQRQEAQLKKKLRELEASPHRFVRLLGQEQMPNKPFEMLVMNSSVAHQVKRGERHPFYDNSWARPQPVHVWAMGLDEARELLERTFPKTVGFKVVHAGPMPGEPATPSPPSLAAEAAE
ncbi:MAG TPA: hypothetical protein VEB20_12025 [Azospirillaceae bacterium]|nr:hypothetical protein [Azospirillaceae bacterium]